MNIVFNVNGEEVRTTIAELMNAKDLEDMKMPDSYIDFFRKNVSIYGLIDKDTTDKMQTNIDRLITTTHLNE